MEAQNKKTTIYIADFNQGKELGEIIKKQKNFEVLGISSDGVETLNEIKKQMPDVLLMDVVLSSLDGFAMIEEIQKSSLIKKPKIIIISSLTHEGFITKAMQLGVSYFMIKPVDEKVLIDRITDITKVAEKPLSITSLETTGESMGAKYKAKILEEKITNIFITVGIPAHIKGYHFLREAIKLAIDSPEIINSITKKLYPTIAEKFETSPSKVERAIRHAIEVAWNRGKIENINSLFGLKVYNSNEKPTNGEFIALVADKMLIEGA